MTGYVEKPTLSFPVSMGVYVYEPRVLDLMPPGHFDFPDVVHLLIEQGEPVVVVSVHRHVVRHRHPERPRARRRGARARGRADVTQWRVPLADVLVTDDDIAAVVETYRSGWLSMGPRTEELEERFADVHRSASRGGRHQRDGSAASRLPRRGHRARRRGRRPLVDVRRHRECDRLHGCDAGLRRHRLADGAVAVGRRRRGRDRRRTRPRS